MGGLGVGCWVLGGRLTHTFCERANLVERGGLLRRGATGKPPRFKFNNFKILLNYLK